MVGQAGGLPNATPLGDVVQDRDRLVRGEAGVEARGAFAFGEAGRTGAAVEEATLVRAVVTANGQVVVAALAEVGAVRVLAAEDAEVVHGRSGAGRGEGSCRVVPFVVERRRPFNTKRTPPKCVTGQYPGRNGGRGDVDSGLTARGKCNGSSLVDR